MTLEEKKTALFNVEIRNGNSNLNHVKDPEALHMYCIDTYYTAHNLPDP